MIDLKSTHDDRFYTLRDTIEDAERAAEKRDEHKGKLDAWRATVGYILSLDDKPAEDSLDGNAMYAHLRRFANRIVGGLADVVDGDRFVQDIGGPATPTAHPDAEVTAWDSPDWTVAHGRRAVAKLFDGNPRYPAVLPQWLQRATEQTEAKFKVIDDDARERLQAVADANRRMTEAAILPPEITLSKLTRYESHLSRQMTGALHELQRLQATRQGDSVPPPGMLDVTLHVDNGECTKQSQSAE
jgi:hypothetical protein